MVPAPETRVVVPAAGPAVCTIAGTRYPAAMPEVPRGATPAGGSWSPDVPRDMEAILA